MNTLNQMRENRHMQYRGFISLSTLLIIAILLWFPERMWEDDLYDPVALFLTWQQDPTTTMTIDWHTTPEDGEREAILQYKWLGDPPYQAQEWGWREVEARTHQFPHSERMIHRVELTGLKAGTEYRIRFGEDSKTYYFKTMPADLREPVRFVTGGDTSHEEHRVSAAVMNYDPDFVLWGGDLAYCNGDPARVHLWYEWFDGVKENLISDNGRVIPVVVAIGNHELFGERRYRRQGLSDEEIEGIMKEHDLWEDKPTFFFDLFAFPGDPTYNVLDFADYMSLVILDTNHHMEVEGRQTDWLEEVLSGREGRSHIFPVYHRGAYPSHRSYSNSHAVQIRDNWVPLFEKYSVRTVFENHDHTYKRTHPIREGEINGNGVVYFGDGNWGREPRDGDSRDEWYIDGFASALHGILVTLQGPHQHFMVIDKDGEIIDEYPRVLYGPLTRP